jgi:uncharacterized protein (TIGR00661 family)
MKFAFIIQGEGRGHQTQAIAMAEMLTRNGHEVAVALVGTTNPNQIPILLQGQFNIETFKSPSLVFDPRTKALSLNQTLKKALPHLRKYVGSLSKIKKTLAYHKPDVIINFYDFLGGIYSGFCSPPALVICIGHQYLLLNKNFEHPQKHWWDKTVVNFNTHITALGASKLLALSFSEFPNYKGITTTPPLLRRELSNFTVSEEGYILVYLTQAELIGDVLAYAEANPNVVFEVFIDKKLENIPFNVNINAISSMAFLEKMAHCKGIISTAGFEAICEAMYFGKPVMMVPIPNHYEQLCNAHDGQRAGAGVFSPLIDVNILLDYIPRCNGQFNQNWIHQAEAIFMKELSLSNAAEVGLLQEWP